MQQYQNFRWIVTDPDLLSGQPVVRGTRLSVAFVLHCLAEGMTIQELHDTYVTFPDEALSEILHLAAERLESPGAAAWFEMWLLDKNVPIQLISLLSNLGIEAVTADAKQWGALRNGELVSAAVEDGITCILTRDRLFAESGAKALKAHVRFAVVLVTLAQARAPSFLEAFPRRLAQGAYRTHSGHRH